MSLAHLRREVGNLNDLEKSKLLKTCLDLFFSGTRNVLDNSKVEVQFFDQFSVVDINRKQLFPLKFATANISAFRGSVSLNSIFSRLDELVNDLLPSSFEQHGSGTEWEYIIELAVLLQCLKAGLSNGDLAAFNLVGIKIKEAVFVHLSDNVDTLEKAYNDIQLVAIDSMPGTLMFFKPSNSNFQKLDGLIVLKQSNELLKIRRYQVKRGALKLGNNFIKSQYENFPWLDQVFWIQGAPTDGTKSDYGKVHFLKIQELNELVGYSLGPFIPVLLDALNKKGQYKRRNKKSKSVT
jgi:hypothetical protein